MILLFAFVVAAGCAIASGRRLWLAAHPTRFDPRALREGLPADDPLTAFRALAEADPAAAWERDLAEALTAPADVRPALVNEQLGELDANLERWSRVPRVCARVSTSFALVLATLALRRGLTDPRALTPDVQALVLHGFVGDALTIVACGLAGAAFCVAAHTQAQLLVRERRQAADKLLERLERASAPVEPAAPPT